MNEEEIRPSKIFDEYLDLAKQDSVTYFKNVEKRNINCPACDSTGEHSFDKYGFSYEVCPCCQSLFVSPRPIASAFTKFYTESSSSKYWASTFYKDTAEARREKLWKPKACLIRDILQKYDASLFTLIDIGGGYGLFAEEFRLLTGKEPLIIEPSPELAAACRERSLKVVENFLEDVTSSDLPLGPKVFVSFELFEHLHDPYHFLRQVKKQMNSGDIFIFTTLSGSGVDIQALWENSKSIMPPHHLNFLNPRSIEILLSRLRLENLSITTPGKLDIDILTNNFESIKDRFWRTFITTSSEDEKLAWQKMISETGWSSHMMVVCRKV